MHRAHTDSLVRGESAAGGGARRGGECLSSDDQHWNGGDGARCVVVALPEFLATASDEEGDA